MTDGITIEGRDGLGLNARTTKPKAINRVADAEGRRLRRTLMG
jgi:hypothetical protein